MKVGEYEGNIYWVTGATSGIGEETCKFLASHGGVIILSARNQDNLEKVRLSLKNPEKHHILPLDLSNLKDVELLVDKAWMFNGAIDVLINNAGISQRSCVEDTLIEVDRTIMEVNYFGAVLLSKTLLPKFIESEKGMIINVASIAGKLGVSGRSAYSAAKHALIGFMDCLRAEVAEKGIKVINVCPSFVKTNLSKNALQGDMSCYGETDSEVANGMLVTEVVFKIFKAVSKGKEQIIIASGLPLLGYHFKRFFPNTFLRLSRTIYKRKKD